MLSAIRTECGVDYLTAVTMHAKSTSIMMSRAERFALQERRRGNYSKPWSMWGFEGFKLGQLQLGYRGHQGIVRLSGGLASEAWFDFYQDCDRVTRIDVQETFRLDQSPLKYVLDQYKRALSFKREHHSKHQVRLITDSDGGATLYLGSRRSDNMLRLYNKEAESKLDQYEKCVRVEGEFKGRLGLQVSAALGSGPLVQDSICGYLSEFTERKGCLKPIITADKTCSHVPRSPADFTRVLAWLRTSISPSLRRLLDDNKHLEVAKALNLSESDLLEMIRCYQDQRKNLKED
jgi:DNA relaxase NicK